MEPRRGNLRPWFHRLPNTKSVVVYAGMPNYGLEKISDYIELNRPKVKSMPTVVSVAVIADKSTKDEIWASRSGRIYNSGRKKSG